MSGGHLIEAMTWQEVEARRDAGVDAVLIPIGSTEQHGPHLPLDTDCFIARSLSARAAGLQWTSIGKFGSATAGRAWSSR